ncbi:hypothetical protein EJ02DRAFT_462121 [Clathrospora elynae]|uniref:Uncharacterized protein n=1 Tax=Clathrospora elynae TaxID=706981 RepID=A0A6A5T7U1_9PLEO|nr:hypothetical protein EJ02DRAFT_462121 [Clathrospora elynae]
MFARAKQERKARWEGALVPILGAWTEKEGTTTTPMRAKHTRLMGLIIRFEWVYSMIDGMRYTYARTGKKRNQDIYPNSAPTNNSASSSLLPINTAQSHQKTFHSQTTTAAFQAHQQTLAYPSTSAPGTLLPKEQPIQSTCIRQDHRPNRQAVVC